MANLHVRLRNCLILADLVLVWDATPDSQSSAKAANPRPNVRALKRVMEVQDSHTAALLTRQGVVGTATGISNGRPVILVFVKLRSNSRNLPRVLQRVGVVPVVTGVFYSKPKPDKSGNGNGGGGGDEVDPKTRFTRPVPIGVSTGNAGQCSAGTIGCRVYRVTVDIKEFFALTGFLQNGHLQYFVQYF